MPTASWGVEGAVAARYVKEADSGALFSGGVGGALSCGTGGRASVAGGLALPTSERSPEGAGGGDEVGLPAPIFASGPA